MLCSSVPARPKLATHSTHACPCANRAPLCSNGLGYDTVVLSVDESAVTGGHVAHSTGGDNRTTRTGLLHASLAVESVGGAAVRARLTVVNFGVLHAMDARVTAVEWVVEGHSDVPSAIPARVLSGPDPARCPAPLAAAVLEAGSDSDTSASVTADLLVALPHLEYPSPLLQLRVAVSADGGRTRAEARASIRAVA